MTATAEHEAPWGPDEVAAHLGLPAHWVRRLHEIGLLPTPEDHPDGQPGWDPEDVRVWNRRTHALAATQLVGAQDLRLLAMALRPVPLRSLLAHSNLARSTLQRRLADTALACLRSVPAGQAARWQGFHAKGATVEQIAQRFGASRSLVRLTLEGLPAVGGGSDASVVFRARPLWRRGLSQRAIADALGISRARLNKAAHALPDVLGPPRWTASTVTEALGWSADNIYAHLRGGTFPQPDGREGTVRWWWPPTVLAWAAANTKTCPRCGARVMLMRNHQRAHPL